LVNLLVKKFFLFLILRREKYWSESTLNNDIMRHNVHIDKKTGGAWALGNLKLNMGQKTVIPTIVRDNLSDFRGKKLIGESLFYLRILLTSCKISD
jgi:hypothetical protein